MGVANHSRHLVLEDAVQRGDYRLAVGHVGLHVSPPPAGAMIGAPPMAQSPPRFQVRRSHTERPRSTKQAVSGNLPFAVPVPAVVEPTM